MHVLCTGCDNRYKILINVHQDAGAGNWITCSSFLQLESWFMLEASTSLPCSWSTGNCAATCLTDPDNKLPGKIELLLTIAASGTYWYCHTHFSSPFSLPPISIEISRFMKKGTYYTSISPKWVNNVNKMKSLKVNRNISIRICWIRQGPEVTWEQV